MTMGSRLATLRALPREEATASRSVPSRMRRAGGLIEASTPPPGRVRWQLSAALAVTVVVAFLDRNNITFALTDIAGDMGWDAVETAAKGGTLMSAFYVSYGLSNMFVAPWLDARLGVRRTLLGMVVAFSVITALSATAGAEFAVFLGWRLVLGLAEGVHFPMMAVVTRRFFPPDERSRGTGLYASGILASVLVAPLLLIPLQEAWGWRTMFGVLALSGCALSLPLVARFVYDGPDQHPRMSLAERQWIGDPPAPEPGRGPWALAASHEYRWVTLTGVLAVMSSLGLLSWLPAWLEPSRGFTPA